MSDFIQALNRLISMLDDIQPIPSTGKLMNINLIGHFGLNRRLVCTKIAILTVVFLWMSPSISLASDTKVITSKVQKLASKSRNQSINWSTSSYPDSPQVDQIDDYHGQAVADPYRWLEELESQQTVAWAKAQNKLTESLLDHQSIAEIKSNIQAYSNFHTIGALSFRGDYKFYLKGWSGTSTAALFVESIKDGKPRHLAGPDILNKPAKKLTKKPETSKQAEQISGYWPSPDGKHIAVLQSKIGERWGQLLVMDVASGKVLSEISEGITVGLTGISWSRLNKKFLLTRFDAEGKQRRPVNARIEVFKLSDRSLQPVFVPDEKEDRTRLSLGAAMLTDSNRFVVSLRNGSDAQNRIMLMDLDHPKSPALPLFDKLTANRLYLGNKGDQLWFYTDEEAVNGKVVRLDIKQPRKQQVVIPESANPISANSRVGGNALGMFGERIALTYLEAGGYFVKGFDLNGKSIFQFDVPASGSIWGGFRGDPETDDFYYSFLGVGQPSSFYRVDSNGKQTLVAAPELPFDMQITAKRIYVKSTDGAMVPVVIAHRKDLDLSKPKPLFLYGYGGFGWVSFAWYQPHLMEWFARDGIFAVAGVRGGGEYGTPWHEAGVKHNRQNAIDDYVASSEWLIEKGLTSQHQLVANGGSFSGALAASAVAQRPDLYAAAIIDFPILDLIRYVEFGQARFWISELGDPALKDDFEVLLSQSPYHGLSKSKCLPATLVRVGQYDNITTPMHGYKYVAAAQQKRRCEQPVLLDIMEGAGHNYGSNPEEIAHANAVALSFIAAQLARKQSDEKKLTRR
ncbi:prolyl oligopeptidase family serine peptidase [Aliikangiella coralliicola]|uniref:prolyl oligopeptidase n=1 Tax=Aliikangiella coralliicola TaxID=2592383 RepID=A0A545UG68_9GAMM|nr:prolyl oligopeptidase family serine peptidase [Aliikangiella coralliicola]TQV88469.1 S9 family peptidase [Aliikangiella coralliicola]